MVLAGLQLPLIALPVAIFFLRDTSLITNIPPPSNHTSQHLLKQSKAVPAQWLRDYHILQDAGKRGRLRAPAHRTLSFVTMLPAFLLLLLACVTLVVARSIRQFLALRQFGGHWSAGWSRLWLLRTQSSGEMNKRFTAITDKHGE